MYGNLKRFVSIVITIAVIMTMTITPGFADDTPIALSEQDEAACEEVIQEEIETYTYSQGTGEDEEGYNDELFARYVEENFFPELGGYSTGDTMLRAIYLSERNQIIYSKLKSQIEDVAAGNSTSAVFTVGVDDLGLTDASWTAEDLGVSQLRVNGQLTNEAKTALMDLLEIDTKKVMDALLAQCPYELYWYDKTAGVSISGPGYSVRTTGAYNERVETLYMTSGFTFKLTVASGYASGQYEVSPYNMGRVMAAIDAAQEIVSEAAYFSDYDKLMYYKDRICKEVSYNHEATDPSYDYGDPWQLISVFDRDETTNVVCEGYSKAFKYLCDLSTFDEEGLECIIVSGTMSGATGAGNHMWNIVTINGGNYLVDVTNCDEGTIGAPDQLFLMGTENGSVQNGYTFTLSGGDIYYSYNDNTLGTYSEELVLMPTGYKGEEIHVTEDGIMYSILNGNAVFKGYATELTDHVIIPEEVEGYTVASIGRSAFYGNDALTNIYIPSCVTSIGVEAFALTELANIYYQGTYDEWENVSKGYDAVPDYANILCEADLVEGHIYVDDVGVTTEPTCTEEGEGVRECRICGEHQTVTVPALGHDLIHHDGKEATCTEGGWDEYDTCSRCDYTTYTATEPKGHTPEVLEAVAPTCTENGLTEGSRCAVCGETLTMQLIVNALGHDFHVVEGSAVEPTCTTDGKEADQVCSRCGELQEGTYLQASGHTEIELYAVEPTCTEPGLTAGKKCYFCGEILEAQEEIPATGHSWGEWTVVKEATADEDGLMRRVCANDASHIEEEIIPKTGGVDPGDEKVLDTIEITNINTEIIPGEKVEFTAELLSANMTIENERWFKTDQMKILTGGSDDLPEVGEEYKYFITIKVDEGYSFADDPTVKYNGEVVDADIHVDSETNLSITGIIPDVTVTEQEVEEPEEMAVDFYDTTGNLTWYWVPEYGPATYELRITNAGSALPENPCATKYIESGNGPFYFMIYQEINNLLNNGTLTKSEAYRVSLSAVNQQGKVFQKWEKNNLKIPVQEITAVYERVTPFEVIMERDFKDYGDGLQYYGKTIDYPDAGEKVTFTFPDGTTKVYVYERKGSSYGKFVNVDDSTDVINYSNIYINVYNQSDEWEPGGDKNYYEVTFINYPEDASEWITCRVPIEVSSTPVASVEYEPVPVLLWANDAGRSGMPAGSKVTVTYKDGTSEVFVDDYETHSWISQETNEPIPANDNLYYEIWIEQDREELSCTASYMGVTSEKNYGAIYVAQSISLYQEKPMVLKKGKNSTTKTDAAGNEYEEYELYKYDWFGENDVLTVTYKNGMEQTIDVDYVADGETSFYLAEDSPYHSGYPDDHLSGNYITIHMPDQSENHFEVGKTYSMDMTYQLVGSNFEYPAFTTEGEPYKVLIRDSGSEDVTRVYFEDMSNIRIANGETAQLEVKWEPANVTDVDIEWTSTHPEVATVDENGLVTANLQNGQTYGDTQIIAKIGNYSARKNIIVYTPTEFTDQNVNLMGNTAFYTGEPRTFNVRCGSNILTEGKDYEAVYSNNTYIGDASVTITGKGDYKGTVTKTFKIVGRVEDEITQFTVEHEPIGEYTYSGEAFTPAITFVSAVGKGTSEVVPLVEGEDYEVSYNSNINAGTGRVTVSGLGYYFGGKTFAFTINPLEITPEVTLDTTSYTYDGTAKEPAVTVKYGDKTLTKDKDYTVTYSNNVNAGTAKVSVSCKGNYTGTAEKTFRISPLEVSVPKAKTGLTYTGKAQVGVPTGTYYTITNNSKTNAGSYTATATLKDTANYVWKDNGSSEPRTISWKIAAKKITPTVTLSATSYTYDGKVKKPTVTVKNGSTKLTTSSYTLTYASGRKNVGSYTVTVKPATNGNYTWTAKKVTFKINPKGTTLKTLTATSKGFKATWTKQATKMSTSFITGYQIQYSTSSKFTTSTTKSVTVTKYSTVSKTVSKLTAKKKYYVRIRTYKTVSGTKYYSPWSASKYVTTKA